MFLKYLHCEYYEIIQTPGESWDIRKSKARINPNRGYTLDVYRESTVTQTGAYRNTLNIT